MIISHFVKGTCRIIYESMKAQCVHGKRLIISIAEQIQATLSKLHLIYHMLYGGQSKPAGERVNTSNPSSTTAIECSN